MQNQSINTFHATTPSFAITKPLQLAAAFLLGTVILYGVGFMNTSVAHNAAHDVRHSEGFPCH